MQTTCASSTPLQLGVSSFASFALVMVIVSACATLGGGSRGLDPVGTFDFTTEAQGTSVNGTIVVTHADGRYSGTISTNVTESMSITSVNVMEQTMNIGAMAPDGEITMSLTFTGDDFTGTWSYAGMTGTMTGSRRAT